MTLSEHLIEAFYHGDHTHVPYYAYGAIFRRQNNLPCSTPLPTTKDNYGAKIWLPLKKYYERADNESAPEPPNRPSVAHRNEPSELLRVSAD